MRHLGLVGKREERYIINTKMFQRCSTLLVQYIAGYI